MIDLRLGQEAGKTRQKPDLCLDFVANRMPAHRNFRGLAEKRLRDEFLAFMFQFAGVFTFVAERGFQGHSQGDGGNLADFATREKVAGLLQIAHQGSVQFAAADGKIAGEENLHDLLAKFREAFRNGKFFFQRTVIDQYFHSLFQIKNCCRRCQRCSVNCYCCCLSPRRTSSGH